MGGSRPGVATGPRVVVVGASSGIGREVAIRAACDGASVVLAGRRTDLLISGAAAAGDSCAAVTCDVRDPQSCAELVASATEFLGGIDHLVVAAGAARSVGVGESDAEVWSHVLETNLVGPALVVRSALTALEQSRGTVVLLSSVTADGRWPGTAAYAAAKTGLETFAQVLQAEHPRISVCCVIVGATATGVFDAEDPERVRAWFRIWKRRGLVTRDRMRPGEVADAVLNVLRSPVRVPRIHLVPATREPEPVRPDGD